MKIILQFMRRNYKIILPLILLAGALAGFTFRYQPDPEKDKAIMHVLRYFLTQGHYHPATIDDAFSEAVYHDFIKVLDPTKHYFYQSDIEEFDKYKYEIDDEINHDDLTFFYEIYKRYTQRIEASKAMYKDLIHKGFDITKNETYSVDYDSAVFPNTKEEMLRVWRKQLKMRYLSHLYDKENLEKDKQKEDSTYVPESFKTLQKKALQKTEENMDNLYERLDELNRDDWLAYYINSITAQFGPHTNYLSPKTKKSFDISMAGKLEGIGARLQKEGEYTKVIELISGGPAWRAGELEVGDLILKVAQGDGEPLDIVGMRLDDAIEYIKGKKGTEVRLTLKKVDGSIQTISIIRDVVELDETFVKSSIVTKNEKKYGLINLPKFYIDFDEASYRNSATDMKKEIKRLKEEGVQGIVVDLRNDGGGSLKTAIEIAGLFIDKGPVVQVKYRDEKARVREDNDPGLAWNGKLVILVNELSASASEIFAAAMQDYHRAVILGSKQTFGKGTVQNFYPLQQYTNTDKDLGYLKMTIQKFYRINGGSTQLKGVTPDVVVPTRYAYLGYGERDEENPMPWDKIDEVPFTPWNRYLNFETVVDSSLARIAQNKQFQLIDANARWLQKNQEDKLVHLNYKKFKEDIENHDNEAKQFESLDSYTNHLQFSSPKYELPLREKDSVLAKKRDIWHKNLTKDVYVEEAITLLQDLKLKPE